MNILLTGATGRLGRIFLPLLMLKYPDANITVLARNPSAFNPSPNLRVVQGDLRSLINNLRDISNIDLCIWLASKVSHSAPYDTLYGTNVKPMEMFHAASPDSKMVYVSSTSVYGNQGSITEDSPVQPDTAYGMTKSEAELIVRKFQGYQIIRPPIMIGKGFKEGFDTVFDLLARNKFAYLGSSSSRIPLVHPLDVSSAILFSAERVLSGKSDVFNVCQASPSQKELVEYVCSKTGFKPPGLTVPVAIAKLFAPKHSSLIKQIAKDREVSSAKILSEGFTFNSSWQQGADEVVGELSA